MELMKLVSDCGNAYLMRVTRGDVPHCVKFMREDGAELSLSFEKWNASEREFRRANIAFYFPNAQHALFYYDTSNPREFLRILAEFYAGQTPKAPDDSVMECPETGICPVCHTLWNTHSESELNVCRNLVLHGD